MGWNRRRVSFVTRILTHYRIPFHERVHQLLADAGFEYRLIHGQPDEEEKAKGDLATLPWAEPIRNHALFGRGKLVWQPIGAISRTSDLLVLGQENQLLVNYPLQLLPSAIRPKLAFWGHGRNFQSRNPDGRAERWKRFWATRCDWWFAYTEETRRHLMSLGFPDDRITVFNNAVDTGDLTRLDADIGKEEARRAQASLGLSGRNLAIFVGGLYPDKRLDFLVAAADRIRARVPDFELLVVGGGVERAAMEAAAAERPWLVIAGPRFGREKAVLMKGAKLFLMPGLVGLAVLDAAALGVPIVTTAFPFHSPEIAYLKDGGQGVIVENWTDADAYASAVAELIGDEPRRHALRRAGYEVARTITIEAMAQRFARGAECALS